MRRAETETTSAGPTGAAEDNKTFSGGAVFQLRPPKTNVPTAAPSPPATTTATSTTGASPERSGPSATDDAWSVFQMRAPRKSVGAPPALGESRPSAPTQPLHRPTHPAAGRSFLEPPRTHLVPPAHRPAPVLPQDNPSPPGAATLANQASAGQNPSASHDNSAARDVQIARGPAPASVPAAPQMVHKTTPAPVPISPESQAAGLLRVQSTLAERAAKASPAPVLETVPELSPAPAAPSIQAIGERSSTPSHIRNLLQSPAAEAEEAAHGEAAEEIEEALWPTGSAAAPHGASLLEEVPPAVVVEPIATAGAEPSIRLASLFRVLVGGGLDAALVALCAFLATVAMYPDLFAGWNTGSSMVLPNDPFWWTNPLGAFAVAATLFSTLYHAWFLPSLSATLGQRLVGTRTVTYAHAARPAYFRAALRGAAAAVGCLGFGVGPLWAIWVDSHRRGLGDRCAGTVMVMNFGGEETHVG